MRNILILTFCVLLTNVNAQEANKKSVKKELRYYKKHINEYMFFKSEYRKQDSIITEQEILIEKLSNEINEKNQKLILCSTEKDNTIVEDTRVMPEGRSYQIQVGLYKNDILSKYLKDPKYFGYELDNNMIRYHVGYFIDYVEAKEFLDVIRKMGIKDAFITEYINGERVVYTSNTDKYKNTSTTNNNYKMENNWELDKDEEGNDIIYINTSKTTIEKNTYDQKNKLQDNWKQGRDNLGNEIIIVNPTSTNNKSNEKLKLEKNWEADTDEYGNDVIYVNP